MDFTISPELEALRLKVRAFVDEHVLPVENDRSNWNEYDNIKLSERDKLREKAKAAGIWAPQMHRNLGGLGLSMSEQAVIYEEANRSIFGPLAFNCSAPDDGNMRLLDHVGTDLQKERFLMPIVEGRARARGP